MTQEKTIVEAIESLEWTLSTELEALKRVHKAEGTGWTIADSLSEIAYLLKEIQGNLADITKDKKGA